jgi:hypothetical protein
MEAKGQKAVTEIGIFLEQKNKVLRSAPTKGISSLRAINKLSAHIPKKGLRCIEPASFLTNFL